MKRHDTSRDLDEIDQGGFWRRKPSKFREFRNDVRDATHFFKHRRRGLLEVFIKRRIISRTQTPKGFDCGSNRRQWIFDFVRHLPSDFSTRSDALGRRETSSNRCKLSDRSVVRVGQLTDFTTAATHNHARLPHHHFTRFSRQLHERRFSSRRN